MTRARASGRLASIVRKRPDMKQGISDRWPSIARSSGDAENSVFAMSVAAKVPSRVRVADAIMPPRPPSSEVYTNGVLHLVYARA